MSFMSTQSIAVLTATLSLVACTEPDGGRDPEPDPPVLQLIEERLGPKPQTFTVDGERVFVGSFNVDPRSAALNTELGFVIDSPVLARAVDEAFARNVSLTAYRLERTDAGALRWIEQRDGETIVHADEPGASPLRRLGAGLISLLPIDWLL